MPAAQLPREGGRYRARNDPLTRYEVDVDGCWIWAGYTQKNGYGALTRGGKRMLAHKLFYEHHRGPVPEGHDVMHTCGKPGCIRPEHLELISRADHGRLSRPAHEGPGPNPSGRCLCGCGGSTPLARASSKMLGNIAGTPQCYIRGHQRRKAPDEYEADPETGCWNWLRGVTGSGYGVACIGGGKIAQAHRVVFERYGGVIPKGFHLHHVCENKRCVNPDHLEPMTPEEHNALHNPPKAA